MVAVGSSRTSGARRRAIINTLARQQGLAEQTPGCRRHRQQQHLHAAASSSSSNGGGAARAKEAEGIHASRSGAAHGTLPLHTATQPYTHTSRHGKGGPSIAGHEVAQRERKRPQAYMPRAAPTIRRPSSPSSRGRQAPAFDHSDTDIRHLLTSSARPVLAGWSRRSLVERRMHALACTLTGCRPRVPLLAD